MSTIILRRTWSDNESTLGNLYVSDADGIRQEAYTLEDPHQDHKIPGRTRIPEGSYMLGVRTYGSWAARFQREGFPGSLEILDVPGFTDVLVHYGNDHEDTEGCPLIGYSAQIAYLNGKALKSAFLGTSKQATLNLYRIIFDKINSYPGYSWKFDVENWEYR